MCELPKTTLVQFDTFMSRCAFTSNQSTYDGRSFADCAGNKGAWAFVRCDACEPEQQVFRCTACYHKFQTTLRRRLPELEKHQRAEVVSAAELTALLEIDFKALAAPGGAAKHDELELVEAGGQDQVRVWRWRGRCPCCYDFVVPVVRAAMPTKFTDLEPKLLGDEIIMVEAPVLDDATGLRRAGTEVAVVRVVTIGGVLTREQELAFRFRAADPPEHRGYFIIWQPPQWPEDATRHEQRWTLLRSAGSAEQEPKALSLIAWRRLDGVAVEHDVRTIGSAFLDCMRDAAGYHRSGPSRENILHGDSSVLDSCIRVNRVSGPFGHVQPGSSFRSTAALVTAREVGWPPCTHNPSPSLTPALPILFR